MFSTLLTEAAVRFQSEMIIETFPARDPVKTEIIGQITKEKEDAAERGHKGAGSRSGTSTKRGFEGGQMPLYRRIPKFGFKSLNRVEYSPINLD